MRAWSSSACDTLAPCSCISVRNSLPCSCISVRNSLPLLLHLGSQFSALLLHLGSQFSALLLHLRSQLPALLLHLGSQFPALRINRILKAIGLPVHLPHQPKDAKQDSEYAYEHSHGCYIHDHTFRQVDLRSDYAGL